MINTIHTGLEEFEEKIEALGQQEEEENKSETWISNLVKEYAKVNSEYTRNGLGGLKIGIVYQLDNCPGEKRG